jgi:hypothetical protein
MQSAFWFIKSHRFFLPPSVPHLDRYNISSWGTCEDDRSIALANRQRTLRCSDRWRRGCPRTVRAFQAPPRGFAHRLDASLKVLSCLGHSFFIREIRISTKQNPNHDLRERHLPNCVTIQTKALELSP